MRDLLEEFLNERFQWLDTELCTEVYSEMERGVSWLPVTEETRDMYERLKEILDNGEE